MTNSLGGRSLLCLKIETGGQFFMVPSSDVATVQRWGGDSSDDSYESGRGLPAIDLNKLLLDIEAPRNEGYILIVSNLGGIAALVVDKMHPAVEISLEEIHPLPSTFANLGCPFSYVTINENGSKLILILDCKRLLDLIGRVSPEFILDPNYAP